MANLNGEFSWNDLNATPVEQLMKYSAHKGYDCPEYRYFRLKNGMIQCKVNVNGSLYSTYPAEFANEFEGQFAAALKAIEAIRADESRHRHEVCLESDLEVANRIYELLANYPNGLFSKRVPEAFLQTHRSLLPDHWFSIIDRYRDQLFVLEDGPGDTMVFACEQPSMSDAASNTSEARQMAVNELQLPWDQQYWDLYITNPVSTVEVWARLVGVDYSDKMDTLITDIEMAMMSAQPKADESEAAVGEYLLASVTDCWYRVRVDEINYDTNECQCFFIDIGDKEQIPLDQLYQCDPKYLELPGQAKRFTLEGLEDFSENPKAKLHLDALISGRVFIGEILTKREEYEEVEQASGIGSGQLKLALYDTSSDHDVLLNPVILKHICDDTPEPALNRKDVNAVTISYIDDQGDVYGQLVGTMEYLQKLITNLTQSNALDGKYRGLYKTKAGDQQHQLYLVQDETDGKWYRAELEAEEAGPSCRMRYVDVGCRRCTNVSNIYRLEMLSLALSRYPPQAIRMRMFGLDLTEPQVLPRLRALLKPAMRAVAKVCAMAKLSPGASASLPLVRVFVYVSQAGSENIPVCVNDAIAFEKELELCSELISAPRISDSVLSNGSSSSTSNTSSSLQSTFGAGGGSLSSTDTKDLALRLGDLKLETGKSSSSGSSATSPTAAANPKAAVAKLPQMTLPAVGQLFDVKVVIASSPNYFIVQPYASAQQLNRLMHELQDFCMKKGQPVRKEHVRQYEVYAALNTDGHWYRVSVTNILLGPTPIHVFFCDFGRIGMLDVSALRVLPANFRVLPQQAINAKLHGVKPLHKDWQAEDAVRFQKLTVERKFASIVRGVQADELNRDEKLVELELIDVSSEEDVYVHKTLVDEGRAVYTAAQTV
ncbi:tudor domain-containing protein 7B-like [Anopheles cruzii]|uniref:tudor domain-containing protein 7B-like n=1 Tax=Anopheles cruzii TaxID=68878 RepID=UPI0022EC663E|nr:tudor domain-containing protein 7B-like [Anopheles cruzii]